MKAPHLRVAYESLIGFRRSDIHLAYFPDNSPAQSNQAGRDLRHWRALNHCPRSHHDIPNNASESEVQWPLQKNFLSPIRVYVLVDWDESASTFGYVDGLHVDFSSQIVVHFHRRRLSEDQNLYTRVGDFIYYGDQYYEITTLKEPRPLFGQVDQSFEITAVCTRARGSYFDAN